ncbi:hypothetical protein CF326_g572 [Tilletia indica]|nr:hypothetical protein CF326_g572 [Tilletia indica]
MGADVSDTSSEDGSDKDSEERGEDDSEEANASVEEDETEADSDTTALADDLFRALSAYHNFRAQIEQRKGVRNSTATVQRLNQALTTEKARSVKAYEALEDHLSVTYHDHKALGIKNLFLEETRHWASAVATQGSVELPWWAEYRVLCIVDAFDHLVRVAEERLRLKEERVNMRSWIDSRIIAAERWQVSRGETRSSRNMIGILGAVRFRWFRNKEPSRRVGREVVLGLDGRAARAARAARRGTQQSETTNEEDSSGRTRLAGVDNNEADHVRYDSVDADDEAPLSEHSHDEEEADVSEDDDLDRDDEIDNEEVVLLGD